MLYGALAVAALVGIYFFMNSTPAGATAGAAAGSAASTAGSALGGAASTAGSALGSAASSLAGGSSSSPSPSSSPSTPSAPAAPAAPAKVILPRPRTIGDCGYINRTRGWYDIRGQGVKNDYCRDVGDQGNPFFQCQYKDGKAETYTFPFDHSMDSHRNDPHDVLKSGETTCM